MAVLPEPTVGGENGTGPAEAPEATRRTNSEIRKVMRAPELKGEIENTRMPAALSSGAKAPLSSSIEPGSSALSVQADVIWLDASDSESKC
jgi:hypothetical protein